MARHVINSWIFITHPSKSYKLSIIGQKNSSCFNSPLLTTHTPSAIGSTLNYFVSIYFGQTIFADLLSYFEKIVHVSVVWAYVSLWASSLKIRAKIEKQEQFLVSFTSQMSYLVSRDMFLQSTFHLSLLPSKPRLFLLRSSLEFVLHRGKPKFISLLVNSPPIDQIFSSVLWPEV